MKNCPTTQKSIAQKLVAKKIYTLKVALTLTLTFLLALILSCASTNNVKNNSPVPSTSPTRITVPRRSSKTFFAPINQEAMLLAEEGSPQSIRKAISLIRKADRNYTDQEKVFLIMLDSIMKIVWPSERIDWDVPIYDGQTPYTGAIDSAKKGIYDLSTGNTDFFTLLLPSLVLLFTEDVNRFAQVSEQALQTSLMMHKNSSLALYLLGVLYQKTHQYEGALNCFYEASTLSPLCLESACAHTEVLLELGEYERAYEKSRSLFSDNQNLTVIKLCAESAFALKKYDEAEEYATLVLEKSPNDLDFILF
ncbi:MAG: CDC27 family protein, partial [Treponema sp.]|nr:CDC27 family protein [Treponema sp.]